MRVLVCGGRDTKWTYEAFVHEMLEHVNVFTLYRHTIIHGGARGIDSYAHKFAKDFSQDREVYQADWKQYGRAAGVLRNRRMLDEGRPELVIAFPGGKGTANMVQQATKAGVKVIEVSRTQSCIIPNS